MNQEVKEAAKGGIMNINDITKPLGYKNAGEVGIREKVIEAIQSGKGNLIDKGFFISPEDIYKGMTKKEIERQKEINKIMTDKFTVDPYEGMSEEKKEEIDRLKSIQEQIHENFIEYVKSRRGSKLLSSEENEIFSGLFWVGKKGVDLGLADGIGSINQIIKERYGNKAKIKIIDQKKSFLQKRLSSSINKNDIINRLEEMVMWSRYGL